ncbi:rhamnosyltransferase, partial [Pseudomonas syringae pv. tagetis]
PDYDVYVYLTQDANVEDINAIANILLPFADTKVGALCGRQLPHKDANLLAKHARLFNYPPTSHIKKQDDGGTLGIMTAVMY